MTEQEKYVVAAAGVFKDCLEILNKRSKKYTGDGDPFANFIASADVAQIDVTQGIMSRFGDKLGRIKQGLNEYIHDDDMTLHGDESFRDSVIDGINYLTILLLWLETGGGEAFKEPEQLTLPEIEPSQKSVIDRILGR